MRNARRFVLVAAAGALAAPATAAETTQLTASDRDSSVERTALTQTTRWIAVRSTGDLTPGAPGNADGSSEVWRADLLGGGLVQATAADLDATCVRVTFAGDLFFASREDLTPGAPGNADGSFESWLFTGAPAASLRQVTAGDRDSFFQTFRDASRTAFYVSRSELVPGGNADGANDVFAWDVASGVFTQATESAAPSVLRGVTRDGLGIVESSGDLAPGGNADGSSEVFLVDLTAGTVQQVTSSAGNARFAAVDAEGRRLAIESRADLVPGGNADGSLEVFVFDRRRGTLRQATSSAGDTRAVDFVHRSDLLAVTSREDLVAGGNADGSQEVYTVEIGTGTVRQLTASAEDSTVLEMGYGPNRWVAIARGTEVHVQRIRRVPTPSFRLGGAAGTGFGGLGLHGRRAAFDSTEDVVPGGNTDGSREVFLADLGAGRPRLVQATATAADSEAAAISELLPVVVIESRADLVAGGNADGSVEVFAYRRGPKPKFTPPLPR